MIDREKELEAKAKYKLKEHDNGQVDRSDKTLLFESKFESGNLYLAQKFRIKNTTYLCKTTSTQMDILNGFLSSKKHSKKLIGNI